MKNVFSFIFVLFLTASNLFCSFDKWIVVTTIQSPTLELKKLAEIPGWRLVVVGDKKTPKDWHLDNCEYLSPERQLELGYELSTLLPWNHYSRKNIGYLFAIQNGAKVIYETDDDNMPLDALDFCPKESMMSSLISSNSYVNIYSYFGRPDVWPRGFPLEHINDSQNYQIRSPQNCVVGIEQGIVNQEPDVDAIFRLTQNKAVFFQKEASCFLAPGTYCPFNSQNTFFHFDAFFSLYMPSSVSLRVTDIWRGFIAQRLIPDFGLVLAFSGPNAIQNRNQHNLMHDYMQEQDLYLKTEKLIKHLKRWKGPMPTNRFYALYDLTLSLIQEKFLGPDELALMEAWINDLYSVGYIKNFLDE